MADYGADKWRWEHGVMKGHENEATPTIKGCFQVVEGQLISDHGRAALSRIEVERKGLESLVEMAKLRVSQLEAERDALKDKLGWERRRVLALKDERDALKNKIDEQTMYGQDGRYWYARAQERNVEVERLAKASVDLAAADGLLGMENAQLREERDALKAALESAPPATVLSSPLYSKWYARIRQALAGLEEK